MKKVLLLFMGVLALNTHAQKDLSASPYSYEVSAPYRVIDGDKFYFPRGNEVMSVKFSDLDIYIQKFDASQPALVAEKHYPDYLPKHYKIEKVMETGNRHLLFYSSWDGNNKQERLFAQAINFDKGELEGEAKLLLKVDGKITGVPLVNSVWGITIGVREQFSILPTHDKKNFLVEYRKRPAKKNDKKSHDVIGLHAFDADLTPLFNKEVTMPYTERRMNNLDFQIDNNGNLFLLAKVFHDDSNKDRKSRSDDEANYHIELFTIPAGSDQIKISKLENKDKFITGLWIFDTPNGELVAGGYYNNGKGRKISKTCDGIITFRMSSEGDISDVRTYEIPVSLISEYESKSTQRRNERKEDSGEGAKLTDLMLKDMVVRADGSIILVGEQNFVIKHTTPNGGPGMGYSTHYTYYYNDIFVSKINPDGSLGWMKKIPKEQVGTNGRGGMGYKFFSSNDQHFFVFLDNVKNIDLPLDKKPAPHTDGKGGYITAVKISDHDGSFVKGSVLNARDMEDFKLYQIHMNRIVKTGENTFVMEAYKKKKEDVMIKVMLN